MNAHLEKVASWLALNKLSLNVEKTVHITFGSYVDSVLKSIDIKIGPQKLNRVTSWKHLGIIFDFNMKWDKHIEYIIKKQNT